MFKEKLELIKTKIKKFFAKNETSEGNNSKDILRKQAMRAVMIIVSIIVVLWLLSEAVNDAGDSLAKKKGEEELSSDPIKSNIDLADKALDTEVFWRNLLEEKQDKQDGSNKELKKELKESQQQMLREVKSILTATIEKVQQLNNQQKTQFDMKARELQAALEEQRLLSENNALKERIAAIEAISFDNEVEFDEPKSVEDYIPEGTYFSGFLLGGVVASTALSAPDENATPVVIRLQGRGNLDKANQLDISECQMTGSAYGDLSSERLIVRLEKMICKEEGVYITSDIAGVVYDDNGFNGIKGTIVSTSTKHLKNAAIGGLLSGLSSASKGQEGFTIGAGGLASSKSKGVGDLLRSGGMSGVSNVGEKLADYYLKQAESMSPVLVIPIGVKLNAQITKGFFVGQRGMKKRIKQDRKISEDRRR